jgi:predicted transposase/invertase (TIGR01784 family)
MQRYLDPINDVAFKRIFKAKDKLLDFLNATLINIIESKIISLDFLPTEEIPDIRQGKRSFFDLKVKDETGKIYIIEMQNSYDRYFLNRVQYYGSHTLASQLKIGDEYDGAIPIIVVSVLNHSLFNNDIPCISYHTTREKETNQCHLFLLSYVFIELTKFTKTEAELSSNLDEWLYFLSKSPNATDIPTNIKDKIVISAYKEIERFNWSEEQYDAYIRAGMMMGAERIRDEDNFEKGLKEGTEKGLKEGVEKGLKEGTEKGLKEGEKQTKITTAKKMLENNIDLNIISSCTGLTPKEIKNLKKDQE